MTSTAKFLIFMIWCAMASIGLIAAVVYGSSPPTNVPKEKLAKEPHATLFMIGDMPCYVIKEYDGKYANVIGTTCSWGCTK